MLAVPAPPRYIPNCATPGIANATLLEVVPNNGTAVQHSFGHDMLVDAVNKLLTQMFRWQRNIGSDVAGHRLLGCLEHLGFECRRHAFLEVPILVHGVSLRLAMADASLEPLGHRCVDAQTKLGAFGVQRCPYQVRARAVL